MSLHCGARKESWELSRSDWKFRIHGTHAQYEMEIIADFVDEVLSQVFLTVLEADTLFHEGISKVCSDCHDLVLRKETGDLSSQ